MPAVPVRGLPARPVVRPVAVADLPPALAERLGPRLDRLGYLGAFFSLAAHQPEPLSAFVDFTESLKRALPADLAQVVALTVASRLANPYELSQHERLARAQGHDDAWIAALKATGSSADTAASNLLTEGQRAARQVAVDVLVASGHGARPAVAAAVGELGEPATVAVLLLVARYAAHALVSNALELTAPVPA